MREFRQESGHTAKPQVWNIERNGNTVASYWGQLNGVMRSTVQKFKPLNVGKANEKDSETVAQEWMDRQILLRTRKGYREVDVSGNYLHGAEVTVGDETIKHGEEMDFANMPQNFRVYKPQNSMNVYIEKLVDAGKAMFLRKRNGNQFPTSIDSNSDPHMFSSTLAPCPKKELVPWIERFPHLKAELSTIPPNSFFGCELVAGRTEDDLDYVGSLTRSLTQQALELQATTEARPYLAIWDIFYLDGEQWAGVRTVEDRQGKIRELCAGKTYLIPVEVMMKGSVIPHPHTGRIFDGSLEHATGIAKANGWEGWVVVDPKATYGEKAVSWHGKADRPKECVKHKPKYEADFILRWDPDNGIGTWGKGKKANGVGAFFAYLLNDEGDEVFVSKVGGGLTDDDVKNYAEPGICFVGQVEFASVTKDGSLQFPEFVRPRPDKNMNECTFDQLPKAAEDEG